jgi:hypothetical protein
VTLNKPLNTCLRNSISRKFDGMIVYSDFASD